MLDRFVEDIAELSHVLDTKMAMNSWGIVYENAELVLFIEPQRFLAIWVSSTFLKSI